MQIRFGRAVALAGALLALGTTFASADLPAKGKVAPAWSGKTPAGKAINSGQYKNKVLLVNFFSYT